MPNACVASVDRSANLRQHGDDTRRLIAEARLLPHAGEWDSIPSGAAPGLNCRPFHNLFDAEQKCDDGERLVGPDTLCEARLRALGISSRARLSAWR
jgi:hypothetical protein